MVQKLENENKKLEILENEKAAKVPMPIFVT
jgi:hypothetical protein